MNVAIGDILIDKIKTLPWIDKYAGVVRTIVYEDGGTKKRFPAYCRLTPDECEQGGKYRELCPDSSKKSVLYLEDRGVRLIQKRGPLQFYRGGFDLIGWLNLPKLGYSGCNYSAIAVTGIIDKIPSIPFNSGDYKKINITVTGEAPKSQNPFAKYSYEESVNQMLLHPFDYFVLQIDVEFFIDTRCIVVPSLGAAINCPT